MCLAKDTVHSLSSCYGLLTALVLFNSVAICCNTVIHRVNHGTYLSVPFPSHSNLCLFRPIPSHGTFPMGFL